MSVLVAVGSGAGANALARANGSPAEPAAQSPADPLQPPDPVTIAQPATSTAAAPSAPSPVAPERVPVPSAAAPQPPAEPPVGWLSIDRIGLHRVPIMERGLSPDHQMLIAPGYAVSHYSASAPLGGASNAVLYGHDDMEGAVFRHLDRLARGDTVIVELVSPGGTVAHGYTVAGRRLTAPRDLSPLEPSTHPELTLFSCYPYMVDDQRIVVTAESTAPPGGNRE